MLIVLLENLQTETVALPRFLEICIGLLYEWPESW